jgi:hypothetical protein
MITIRNIKSGIEIELSAVDLVTIAAGLGTLDDGRISPANVQFIIQAVGVSQAEVVREKKQMIEPLPTCDKCGKFGQGCECGIKNIAPLSVH